MAITSWIGNAQPITQVYTITIGTYDATTTYTVTINNKAVGVLGQGGTATTTAVALLAALQLASGQTSGGIVFPEFAEITWTQSGANIIATANTPGYPFIAAGSASGGTGTISGTATVACSGPNFFSNAANWSNGIPAGGDTAYFDNTDISLLYSLSWSGIVPAAVIIGANFTGHIGLPQYNTNNPSGTYREYRDTAFTISAVALEIGSGGGAGSGLIRINTAVEPCAAIVYGTGQPFETGVASVVLDMNATTSSLSVVGGSVGVGVLTKASNTVGDLFVGQASEQSSISFPTFQQGASSNGTSVVIGPKVAIAGGTSISSGSLLIDTSGGESPGPTINQYGGTLEVIGTAGTTNLNIFSGICFWSSTGAIANALVGDGGALDFSQDLQGKSVASTVQLSAGSTLNDPYSVVDSLAFQPVNCTLAQVTVSVGFNHTFTRT